MDRMASVGSGPPMDLAAAMAEAALALKEPETVEQALARLVGDWKKLHLKRLTEPGTRVACCRCERHGQASAS